MVTRVLGANGQIYCTKGGGLEPIIARLSKACKKQEVSPDPFGDMGSSGSMITPPYP